MGLGMWADPIQPGKDHQASKQDLSKNMRRESSIFLKKGGCEKSV